MSFVKFVFVNKLTSSTYQHNSYIVWSNQYAKNLIPIQHICGRQCSTRKTESISFYSNVKICRVERTEIWNFLFLTLCAWCAKLLWDYRSYADSHTLSQCDILLLVFFEHCFGPQLFYKLMLTICVEWSSHIISYCIALHIFRLFRKI